MVRHCSKLPKQSHHIRVGVLLNECAQRAQALDKLPPFFGLFGIVPYWLRLRYRFLDSLGFDAEQVRGPLAGVRGGFRLKDTPTGCTVTHVETVNDEPDFPTPALRVSIFLSVFNVHVNRVPRTATVTSVRYYRGEYPNNGHHRNGNGQHPLGRAPRLVGHRGGEAHSEPAEPEGGE